MNVRIVKPNHQAGLVDLPVAGFLGEKSTGRTKKNRLLDNLG